ncbi:hypothetical protein [Runella zeae]|uniref:hypothetical protein n=1 Tax=Runella zeae TaxID=94255 RepID=UPI0023560622|nr:hypothetical protein [Runella zeae]
MLKKVSDKGVELTSNIIKNSSKNILSFVVYITLLLIAGIIGLASFSKLAPDINNILILTLTALLILVIVVTLVFSFIRPQQMIFNQNAFIISAREKLYDSNSVRSYFSNELTEESENAMLEGSNEEELILLKPSKSPKQISQQNDATNNLQQKR